MFVNFVHTKSNDSFNLVGPRWPVDDAASSQARKWVILPLKRVIQSFKCKEELKHSLVDTWLVLQSCALVQMPSCQFQMEEFGRQQPRGLLFAVAEDVTMLV